MPAKELMVGDSMAGLGGRLADLRKSFSWVIFGIGVTTAYAAYVLWAWSHSGPQPGLSLNELADALAGLFAPPAFLWLFVATMVQSQELSLQRRELQLTRREFEQTREVARLQAEEAKNQAAFIGTQTRILVMQEADRHVDVLLTNLVSFMRLNFLEAIAVRADNGDSLATAPPIRATTLASDGVAAAFLTFHDAAREVRRALSMFPDRIAYGRVSRLGLLVKRLMAIQMILPEASPAKASYLAGAGFGQLVVDAEYLWKVCQEAAA